VRELVGDLRGLGLALDCVLHRGLGLGQIIQVSEYLLPPDFCSILGVNSRGFRLQCFVSVTVKEEKASTSRRYFCG